MLEKYRERVREKARRAEMRETGGVPTSVGFHRPAYHRNFQGYTEVKRINAAGKAIIERVYTGHYYEPMLSRERRITLRVMYLLLFVGGVALFAFTATRSARCNSMLYVGLFQAAAVLMAPWCLYVLIFYLPATGKLTIGEYDTLHKPLIRAALACAICQWLAAAACAVCFLLHLSEPKWTDLFCAGGFAAAGALFGLIWFLESHLEYAVLDNETPTPEDGVEIDK